MLKIAFLNFYPSLFYRSQPGARYIITRDGACASCTWLSLGEKLAKWWEIWINNFVPNRSTLLLIYGIITKIETWLIKLGILLHWHKIIRSCVTVEMADLDLFSKVAEVTSYTLVYHQYLDNYWSYHHETWCTASLPWVVRYTLHTIRAEVCTGWVTLAYFSCHRGQLHV